MMLYHNEPPNGNGKSQPNRNIMDDNTEIRKKKIAKYNGIHILKFRVTSLEQLSLAEFSGQ